MTEPKKTRLTREEMVGIVRGGGSVLVHTPNGIAHVSKEADLPSDADLAQTAEEKESTAAALKARIDDLQAQVDKLQAESGPAIPVIPADNGDVEPK